MSITRRRILALSLAAPVAAIGPRIRLARAADVTIRMGVLRLIH
jgi:hypothetical protein